MPCYKPQNRPHPTWGIAITVPCGKCIGCRLERSRQWAVRIVHETKMHEQNCFITLTYEDKKLPPHLNLVKSDVQKFIKRLRKSIEPKKISYFAVGEYGSKTERPHYHIIIFGHDFDDKKFYKNNEQGDSLFVSKTLEKLWGCGFSPIGSVTFESAAYCARYCVEKLDGELGAQAYEKRGRIAPFMHCSTKPAIGKRWLEKYFSDVYPHDEVISNKRPAKPPRYYDKILGDLDSDLFIELSRKRRKTAEAKADFGNYEKLAVKETVKKSQISTLRKKL